MTTKKIRRNLDDLKVGDNVVVSIVLGKEIEVRQIASLSANLVTTKSLAGNLEDFNRETGFSILSGGELLEEQELAIRETGEIKCLKPICGVQQKQFFMVSEYLQGGKNFSCYNCGTLHWIDIKGNVKRLG